MSQRAIAWDRLADKTIFFGHQSVGANIIEGIRDLMAPEPHPPIRIVQTSDPAAVRGPALVEFPIGRNGDPGSKIAAFAAALDAGVGRAGGVALFKYCYVDVLPSTDARAMFEEYRATVGALHTRYPALTIVHVTIPLTIAEGDVKAFVKRALGRQTHRDLNARRGEFNALLLREYGGREPVFDLARIESTRPDGSRAVLGRGAGAVYVLASEYTTDGGHLNEAGRRVAAAEFLELLATL